ncbi:MAG TPA: serine hydrolase [Allosphingosinicella sp.]
MITFTKTARFASVGAALAVAGIATPSPAAPAAQAQCAGDGDLRQDLERFASELYRAAYPEVDAPGIAIAVIRRDCDVLARGFGYADLAAHRPIDQDTRFYIASSTKAFTGLAAELLHLQRRLDLDAPIARYLPNLRLAPPLDPARITTRQLITHTHGIENWGPVVFRTAITGDWDDQRLEQLVAKHPAAAGGTAFEYGNIGYNVAALVINGATGRDWGRWVADLVVRPLGMTSTSTSMSRVPAKEMALPYVYNGGGYTLLPQAKNDRTMHAAGGMVSSLHDLTTWLRATMRDGAMGGRQILPGAAIEEARRIWAKRAEPTHDEYGLSAYGLGWDQGSYRGERVLQSQGGFSAYQTLVSYMPDRNVGIVILTNEAGSGEDMMRTLAQYAYDMALAAPDAKQEWARRMERLPQMVQHSRERLANEVAKRAARAQPSGVELAAYEGIYRNRDWGTVKVSRHNGRLRVRAGTLDVETEPFNSAEHQWRVELQPARGETIKFTVVGGRAQAVELAGTTFDRTR